MKLALLLLAIAIGLCSFTAYAEKAERKGLKRIGYELQFSDGSTTKIVTRDYGAARIWIDGIQHNVFTFLSESSPSIQVETTSMSKELILPSTKDRNDRAKYDKKLVLEFSPTVIKVAVFDASGIDLSKSPGSTTISAGGEGVPKTCGTCGGSSVWVTNACTPCNGGWLCDKIKAPW